jgi:hypothetical protein
VSSYASSGGCSVPRGYTGTKSSKEELQHAGKEKGCQEKEEKVTA